MIIAQIGWQTDINKNKQVNKVKRLNRRTNALQTDRRTEPIIELYT